MEGTPLRRESMFQRLAQGAGQRLEQRFGLVVIVAPADAGVQRKPRMHGQGLEEVLHQVRGKLADGRRGQDGRKDRVRPAAEVDDDKAQRLVHRHVGGANAGMPRRSPAAVVERLAEHDGHVFNGVVGVDVQVACAWTSRSNRPCSASALSIWSRKADAGGDGGWPVPSRSSMSECRSPSSGARPWPAITHQGTSFGLRQALLATAANAATRRSVSSGRPALMRMQFSRPGLLK